MLVVAAIVMMALLWTVHAVSNRADPGAIRVRVEDRDPRRDPRNRRR